jgi:membrane-associated protease RseP (regulator of RpoE activity)
MKPLSQTELLQNQLRQMVAGVMLITREAFVEPSERDEPQPAAPGLALQSHLVATFEGRLIIDSEAAYEQLDQELATFSHLAVFRETKPESGRVVNASNPHTIHILTGRVNPSPRPWWPNALLFIATLFTVLQVGTLLSVIRQDNISEIQRVISGGLLEFWRGLPYAVSILLILGGHEMGHYFAARRHRLAVTLPYFIPLPAFIGTIIGTMGAFIQLRQPMRNRKVLFDVGAAGPLAGLLFAIPILMIGLANTDVVPIPQDASTYEGDSILYAAAKTITFGHFLPDGRLDVCIDCNQLAWAGWVGLLVTALNLIPIGQLDGGHVLYALIGERARRLYYPLLVVLVALSFIANVWIIWVVLLLIFGRIYATPLDMITPLDDRRRYLAIFTLVIAALVFVPMPLSQPYAYILPPSNTPGDSFILLPVLSVLPLLLWLRR